MYVPADLELMDCEEMHCNWYHARSWAHELLPINQWIVFYIFMHREFFFELRNVKINLHHLLFRHPTQEIVENQPIIEMAETTQW